MNVKELKEIVDSNSNDKVNEVFERLYGDIANRAKDGYNSYTTTRHRLGLKKSEFLGLIGRLEKDGYSVYMSDVPVKYLDVVSPNDEGLDRFCYWVATVILKLSGFKTSQIRIVWKFEED